MRHPHVKRESIFALLGFFIYVPLAAIDYNTGSEIRFSLLYLIPIYLVAWNSGRGLAFTICILSILPPLLDRIREAQFVTNPLAFYWNILYKLVFFLVFSCLILKRRESDQRLKMATQELARSNSDLEQFAFIASHDLQEPLRIISSYLGLLEHRYKDKLNEEAKGFIDTSVNSAKRMSALIKNILEYSRIGMEKELLKKTDCTKVLKQALDNLEVATKESGASVHSGPLPSVMGVEAELTQLFQNLIANAIKYRGPAPLVIRVSAQRYGHYWKFVIEDNGIGIEHQYQERIFKIFQRLHGRGAYEGTGMGLATCKKIVERHGGEIWVESEAGKGAKFYFTLDE